MTTYLTGGWFRPGTERGLRPEVLDGAMDAAGLLHRTGVSPELIARLALRIRSLVRLGDPIQGGGIGPDEREIIASQLEPLIREPPVLQGFVADCLEHVTNAAELMAFYLHLVHITRMMQLLAVAQSQPTTTSRKPKRRTLRPASRKPRRGPNQRSR